MFTNGKRDIVEEIKSETKKKRHVHADLIHAWADGAEIQTFDEYFETWYDAETPLWDEGNKYRIKPEKPKSRYMLVGDSLCVNNAWTTIKPSGKSQYFIGYIEDKQDGSDYIFHQWK